jgi:hypothetical protein
VILFVHPKGIPNSLLPVTFHLSIPSAVQAALNMGWNIRHLLHPC